MHIRIPGGSHRGFGKPEGLEISQSLDIKSVKKGIWRVRKNQLS